MSGQYHARRPPPTAFTDRLPPPVAQVYENVVNDGSGNPNSLRLAQLSERLSSLADQFQHEAQAKIDGADVKLKVRQQSAVTDGSQQQSAVSNQ